MTVFQLYKHGRKHNLLACDQTVMFSLVQTLALEAVMG